MKRLPLDLKLRIIEKYKSGMKIKTIVRTLEEEGTAVHKKSVLYWTKKYRIGLFGMIEDVTEKPKKFSAVTYRDIRLIKEMLENDCTTSSTTIHRTLREDGSTMSLKTVKQAIIAAGFTNSRPRYAQMVRDVNKEKRVTFCQRLIDSDEKFEDVIFSDECTVQLHANKTTSYRPIGQPGKTFPKPKHPLKMHVWGAISKRGASGLLIFEDIMNADFFTKEILEKRLLPFIQKKFPNGTMHRFQQDNDPKHRSRLASSFMVDNNINWWREWPSESPDLNPIEMCWNQMKRNIAKVAPTTKDELRQCIVQFWGQYMTKEQCRTYIDHLYKVIPTCVLMKGAATGDMPNKLFKENSRGKSISYFCDRLENMNLSAFESPMQDRT